jgi:hypothetical protein
MKQVLGYLTAKHIFAVRMNSGVQVRTDGGSRRAVHMNAPGTADILAFPRTVYEKGTAWETDHIQPTWIECKAPGGWQSELQKSFQRQVEAEGHKYILAFSVDDLEEIA